MHGKLINNNSTLCRICNEELDEDRVREHCHLSGKFRGDVFNLEYTVQKFVAIVFHNLSGNDSHLFIKTVRNSEGYISYIKYCRKLHFFHETGHH